MLGLPSSLSSVRERSPPPISSPQNKITTLQSARSCAYRRCPWPCPWPWPWPRPRLLTHSGTSPPPSTIEPINEEEREVGSGSGHRPDLASLFAFFSFFSFFDSGRLRLLRLSESAWASASALALPLVASPVAQRHILSTNEPITEEDGNGKWG